MPAVVVGILLDLILLYRYRLVAVCRQLDADEDAHIFVIPVLLVSAVYQREFDRIAVDVDYSQAAQVADPVRRSARRGRIARSASG